MVSQRTELLEKRAIVARLHRASTRKISRIKGAGIELSGTKLDPRVAPGNSRKYTEKQLDAQIERLQTFNSRKTSYVRGGSTKVPLAGDLWRTYKRLEKTLNKKNAKTFETIGDQFISSLGVTAREFQAMKPQHPVTGNPSTRAPHIPVNRSSIGVPNEKQLQKLIKDTQKKLMPEHSIRVNKRDQKIANQMFRTISKHSKGFYDGEELIKTSSIYKDLKNLTPKQFSFLWNYTNFADITSFDYEIAKSKMHDPKSLAAFDDAFDTQLRMMRKHIGDVKKMKL